MTVSTIKLALLPGEAESFKNRFFAVRNDGTPDEYVYDPAEEVQVLRNIVYAGIALVAIAEAGRAWCDEGCRAEFLLKPLTSLGACAAIWCAGRLSKSVPILQGFILRDSQD